MAGPKSKEKKGSSTAQRRQTLLLTAEKLFAERGINAVSLSEINRLAGQKNTSALHYHFGSKRQLLNEILDEHFQPMEDRLNELLDEIEQAPEEEVQLRDVVVAFITPFSEKLASERGVYYLRIYSQLMVTDFEDVLRERATHIEFLIRLRMFKATALHVDKIPSHTLAVRMTAFAMLLNQSLADYAYVEQTSAKNPYKDKETFLSNLADMLSSILIGPVYPSK